MVVDAGNRVCNIDYGNAIFVCQNVAKVTDMSCGFWVIGCTMLCIVRIVMATSG